jgi:hypothetical protein
MTKEGTNDKVVLLDIDRTLFNADLYRAMLRTVLKQEIGLFAVHYLEDYLQSLPNSILFNPFTCINYIAERLAAKRGHKQQWCKELNRIFFDEKLFKTALYAEVIEVLEGLSQVFALGLFSEGLRQWQELKLKLSGIFHFFPHDELNLIFESKRTKAVTDLIPPGAFVADDTMEVFLFLLKVEHQGGFKPVWLNRKNRHLSTHHIMVHDLKELENYLLQQYGSNGLCDI